MIVIILAFNLQLIYYFLVANMQHNIAKLKIVCISFLVINNNFKDKLEALNLSLILLYYAAYLLQESNK